MSTGYKIGKDDHAYFVTLTVIDWVDIFTRKIYRDIILESLTYCRQEKGLRVWAYVIMSNHVHCILSSPHCNLSNIIRDFKRYTAIKILKSIRAQPESRRDWMLKRFEFAAKSSVRNGQHQFWMHNNHAEKLVSRKFVAQKLHYIHLNPVRAGWVEHTDEWMYSSARNYANKTSLIEIDHLEI